MLWQPISEKLIIEFYEMEKSPKRKSSVNESRRERGKTGKEEKSQFDQ